MARVFAFGDATYVGNAIVGSPVVGISTENDGYQVATANGSIYTFGGAQFYGTATGERLNKPIVGIAQTSDAKGYWLAAADGGVFTFGDAQFYGSLGVSTVRVTTAAALFDDGDTPAQIARGTK